MTCNRYGGGKPKNLQIPKTLKLTNNNHYRPYSPRHVRDDQTDFNEGHGNILEDWK